MRRAAKVEALGEILRLWNVEGEAEDYLVVNARPRLWRGREVTDVAGRTWLIGMRAEPSTGYLHGAAYLQPDAPHQTG